MQEQKPEQQAEIFHNRGCQRVGLTWEIPRSLYKLELTWQVMAKQVMHWARAEMRVRVSTLPNLRVTFLGEEI